jgi:hypothetical protein
MAIVATISGAITRGQSFNIDLTGYVVNGDVSVWLIDVAGGGVRYNCEVTVNSDALITATCPDSSEILTVLSSASVKVMLLPVAAATIPTDIGYQGWSTMFYTLDGVNTGSSTAPTAEHDPSLYKLVGQQYSVNGISSYTDDFLFLPQNNEYIDAAEAQAHVASTSASTYVISARGGDGGIMQDPAIAGVSVTGWVDRVANIASICEARGIRPVFYQCWGSSDEQATFGNAKINTDALMTRHPMLVIRTAEIVEELIAMNPVYGTNVDAPGGKYSVPVTTLYSGDTADNFHPSYALAYLVSLATMKALTGISAAANLFVIPSGGASGDEYGMSDQFIADIKTAVDVVQQESIINGLAEGAAPQANNFARTGTHDVSTSINVLSAANLIDDVNINTTNLVIKTITAADFNSYDLTSGVFTYDPVNTYLGDTLVTFTYTDADAQAVDFTLTLTIGAVPVVIPEEIIINFGFGDGTSMTADGNLYNHVTMANGKVYNEIRAMNTDGVTVGSLQDSDGVGTGSITAISGGLNGGGYGGNATPVVIDYGPYPELYKSQVGILNNETISFSVNGLESGVNYRVGVGGRWGELTNIIDVDINGVRGDFDVDSRAMRELDKVVKVGNDGKLTFTMVSRDDVDNWGLSYVWINKITDGTPADTPVTPDAPVFSLQPVNAAVNEGQVATWVVAASDTNSFQWYYDAAILNGITANTYSRTVTSGDSGGLVTVEAIGDGGATLSNPASITILTGQPVITVDLPLTISVVDGNTLNLSITATGVVSGVWKIDSVIIANENGTTLSRVMALVEDGSVITYEGTNPDGTAASNSCVVTVTAVVVPDIAYWLAFGRNDGKASPFQSSTDGIPDVNATGANGEAINFIEDMAPHGTPVTNAGTWRSIDNTVTNLSVTYNSIGSKTATIAAWGDYNDADIDIIPEFATNLTASGWYEHKNLFNYRVFLSENNAFTLEFENGGLVAGDVWAIQVLGTYYQDVDKKASISLNGVGVTDNMVTGPWNVIDVLEVVAAVDVNGRLLFSCIPSAGGRLNFNAIKLIKQ